MRAGARGTALVEFALTTLVFFGMIFAIGDFAVWVHAQNAGTGAAQLAAATAAREGGTPEAGQQAGQNFLRSALGQSADQVRLSVQARPLSSNWTETYAKHSCQLTAAWEAV